ncbi:hypothetical protein BJ742DRAFT_806245 [Cladochytrium replicatum]|nr:hypothetical protein BJ742DRAFT_806245 [Cladochytrium replicatum]
MLSPISPRGYVPLRSRLLRRVLPLLLILIIGAVAFTVLDLHIDIGSIPSICSPTPHTPSSSDNKENIKLNIQGSDQDGAEDVSIVMAPSGQPLIPTVKRSPFSHLAVALKTGADTAIERVPVQVLTFLKDIENLLVIADAPNIQVGELHVHDVYTGLYDDGTRQNRYSKNAAIGHGLADGEDHDEHDTLHRRDQMAEGLTPDNSAQGWKLDAHKNLPGFKILYEKFPDAHWYMMIDDDTYVFFDTLIYALGAAGIDYRDPWYFGGANVFVGCDGVKKFGDGPLFAHGGTGILMSQGAIKKIAEPKQFRSCVKKYRDCFAGDVRTALCLRDVGVLINRLAGFNGMPANAEYNWWGIGPGIEKPNNNKTAPPPNAVGPCARPLTFHHLLARQIQKLYRSAVVAKERYRSSWLEKQKDYIGGETAAERGNFTDWDLAMSSGIPPGPTFGDLFQHSVLPFLPERHPILSDWDVDADYPGLKNIRSFVIPVTADLSKRENNSASGTVSKDNAARKCRDECENDPQCVTFVWDGRTCWLKGGVGSKRKQNNPGSGFVAGVFPHKYRCP